jgi:Zn-dependent protease with chaperone function
MRHLLVALGLLGLFLLAAAPGRADAPDAFERKIIDDLRARDSGAADLFAQANEARERDHAAAARLYGEVFARAPWFTHAERRQCIELLAVGQYGEGLALCRAAVQADPSPQNLSGLAHALVGKPGNDPLSPTEAAEVQKLIARALELDPSDASAINPKCELALRQSNRALLRTCVEQLEKVGPALPVTFYFSWELAMSEQAWSRAADIIARGRRAGVSADLLDHMQKALDDNRPFWDRWLGAGLAILAGWACLMLFLTLAGLVLSRLTLRHAETLSTSTSEVHASGLLRRVYGGVLVVCCGLFYLSLPIVILAVAGLGGGVVYAMFEFGRISPKLVLIAGVMVFFTISAIVKALFARSRDDDPGHKLDLAREPKVRETLDEVAVRIGTRAVDTVYMTPDTSIAVFERKHGERCLVLGAAVMEGMPLAAFKAILAHEYGHFSNRDTAGGGFALRVRRSLLTFILHLARSGQATPWNPAWWFAKGFYLLFLRISQGASRLQEILADRHAALTYGGEAFASGLRHVIERDIHFDDHAQGEVKRAIQSGTALSNLFRAGEPSSQATTKIDEVLNREPSPYDSHPAPRDRIRWVRGIVGSAHDSPEGGSGGGPMAAPSNSAGATVWDLFADRAAIEREMTLVVYSRLAMQGIRLAPLPTEGRAE